MTKLPCLHPAEQYAFTAAEQYAQGPRAGIRIAEAQALLDAIRRLARVVADVEILGHRAQHNGGGVEPEDLYAAIGGDNPDRPTAPESWSYGVEYVYRNGSFAFIAPRDTDSTALGRCREEARLRRPSKDREPGTSGRVMRRSVGAWEVVPDGDA